MRMRTQILNIYLPTYYTLHKVFNRHELTLTDRACLPQLQAVCTGPTCSRLMRPYDYDSNHVLLPRLARAMPGLEVTVKSLKLSLSLSSQIKALKVIIVPCSTAEVHITQAVSFISIRLRIAVHRK